MSFFVFDAREIKRDKSSVDNLSFGSMRIVFLPFLHNGSSFFESFFRRFIIFQSFCDVEKEVWGVDAYTSVAISAVELMLAVLLRI